MTEHVMTCTNNVRDVTILPIETPGAIHGLASGGRHIYSLWRHFSHEDFRA